MEMSTGGRMAGAKPARLANASKRQGTDRATSQPATERGQRTRVRLLAGARVVFERDGFLRARITDICKQSKVSYGSFYTYFPSKEALFLAVVDSVEVGLLRPEAPPPADATPAERIRAANRHFLEFSCRNQKILRVIQEVATFDEDVLATRERRENEFAAAIERRLKEYQAAGIADADLDPLFVANALGGMSTFVAERLDAEVGSEEFEQAVDQLTRLWINALGLRTAPRQRRRSSAPAR